jgi:hypothetical protein
MCKSSVNPAIAQQIILLASWNNGSLVTWTVAKPGHCQFKLFMFLVSHLALSYVENMCFHDFAQFLPADCIILWRKHEHSWNRIGLYTNLETM